MAIEPVSPFDGSALQHIKTEQLASKPNIPVMRHVVMEKSAAEHAIPNQTKD